MTQSTGAGVGDAVGAAVGAAVGTSGKHSCSVPMVWHVCAGSGWPSIASLAMKMPGFASPVLYPHVPEVPAPAAPSAAPLMSGWNAAPSWNAMWSLLPASYVLTALGDDWHKGVLPSADMGYT
jgi:hypothetical protein